MFAQGLLSVCSGFAQGRSSVEGNVGRVAPLDSLATSLTSQNSRHNRRRRSSLFPQLLKTLVNNECFSLQMLSRGGGRERRREPHTLPECQTHLNTDSHSLSSRSNTEECVKLIIKSDKCVS